MKNSTAVVAALAASVAVAWTSQASDTFVTPAPLTPSLQAMDQFCSNVRQQTGNLVDGHEYCEVSQDEGMTWRTISSFELAMLALALGGVGLLIRNRRKKSEHDLRVVEPMRVDSFREPNRVVPPSEKVPVDVPMFDVGEPDSVAVPDVELAEGGVLVQLEETPILPEVSAQPGDVGVEEIAAGTEPFPAVIRYRRAGTWIVWGEEVTAGTQVTEMPRVVKPDSRIPPSAPDTSNIPEFLLRRTESDMAQEPVASPIPVIEAVWVVEEWVAIPEVLGVPEPIDIPFWISRGKYDELKGFIWERGYVTTSMIKVRMPPNTTDSQANQMLEHFVAAGLLKISETQPGSGTNLRYDRIG